jgi:hypothetical protein
VGVARRVPIATLLPSNSKLSVRGFMTFFSRKIVF